MQHWTRTLFLCHVIPLVFILGLAASFTMFLPDAAHAMAVGCRHDPVVTLSNGDVVTITVDIGADASQVASINYTLHVAQGLTASSIVYQDATPGLVETLIVKPDGKKGEYRADTLVNTQKSVAVTVTETYASQSSDASGKSGKTVTVKVSANSNN